MLVPRIYEIEADVPHYNKSARVRRLVRMELFNGGLRMLTMIETLPETRWRLVEAPAILRSMKRYRLTAVVWKEGRRYVSKCPELGVSSFGATPAKAQAALKEAVELFLSNARRLGTLGDFEPILASAGRSTAPLDIRAA
jgi:predicted RNase H-like HicB family nuclease